MRTLPRPKHAPAAVFTLCISRVRNKALRARLESIASEIKAAARIYARRAKATTLHAFSRSETVCGIVTGAEMVAVYTSRMVPRRQPGRGIYDAIIAAAPRGRCPLCGVGQVATLDHHLPKGEYPVLSVTPVNLVPACTWCQTNKSEAYPTRAEEQTLHPYFDDIEGERWLEAVVSQTAPASFSFVVLPPAASSTLTAARLRHHMKVFKLDQLFTSNAADELVSIRFGLKKLHDAGGKSAVRAHLEFVAESREVACKNSWQSAMYRAAAASDWFCDGGFALQ